MILNISRVQTGGTKEEILTTISFLKEAPDVYIHGFNVYHKNRLILPFWPVVNYGNSRGRGVVGVLEANFVEPTHNKQDFERTSLFQKLENRLKEMTWEYWDYHCGLIGYQVIKKVQARSSSFDYVGNNDPRLQPISVDKSAKLSRLPVGHADHVTSLPATTSLATQSNFQQSGFKRTQDDLLSSLGRGRRESRAESNTHSAGPECPMEIQPVFGTAMLLSPQEAIKARQEHKKLRVKCLEHEKSQEELKVKLV